MPDINENMPSAATILKEENARLRREVEDADLLLGDAWQRVRQWKPDGELDVLETLRQQVTKLAGDNAVANQRIEELEGALREAYILLGDTGILTPEEGRKWREKHAHLIRGGGR